MNAEEIRTATEHLRETVSLKNGKWDESMYADVLRQCSHLAEEEFLGALQRCKAELRFPMVPADVTERCPSLQLQSADEAWASIGGKSEEDTVVWTDLTAAAWGQVAQEPDPTARRMAFRKVYERLAEGWRTAGKRPRYQASLGTDPARRTEVIKRAVADKLLPVSEGRELLGLPPVGFGGQKLLPEPPGPIPAQVSLSEADISYLTRIFDPKQRFEPTEVEVRSKLGAYASEKFRLFLAGAQPGKVYGSGCQLCGAAIDENATLHCETCAPRHAAARASHAVEVEKQRTRESAIMQKLGAR